MNYEVYYKQAGKFVEVEIVDVYDPDSRIVGEIEVPLDRDWLDIIDDPLTVFASDNGYAVDDLYADY